MPLEALNDGLISEIVSGMTDAEFYTEFKTLIPKGIYYEAQKKRWRVRLYKEGNVVFLKYYKKYDLAFAAYDGAKTIQRVCGPIKTEKLQLKTTTTSGLIEALALL